MKESNIDFKNISNDEVKLLIDKYLESIKLKSSTTQSTYRKALKEFAAFHKRRGIGFELEDLKKYKIYLEKTKKMTKYSISTYLTSVRRFFNFLTESGYMPKNIAKSINVKIKNREIKFDYLKKQEIDKLLKSIDTSNISGLRDLAIIHTLLYCGCNVEELCVATIGDIQQYKRKFFFAFPAVKGKVSGEIIQIPPATLTAIQNYLQNRKDAFSTEPLFISYSHRSQAKQMSNRGIREILLQRLAESGIENKREVKLTPYTLRHSAGILYAKLGKDSLEIMRRFKIKSEDTARKYIEMMYEFDG